LDIIYTIKNHFKNHVCQAKNSKGILIRKKFNTVLSARFEPLSVVEYDEITVYFIP